MNIRILPFVLAFLSICLGASGQEQTAFMIMQRLHESPSSIELVVEADGRWRHLSKMKSESAEETLRIQDTLKALDERIFAYTVVDDALTMVDAMKDSLGFSDYIKRYCDLRDLERRKKLGEASLNALVAKRNEIDAELGLLEKKKGFIDTCVVGIALNCLDEKFDKKVVDAVTGQFLSIDPSLQEQLSGMLPLLEGYERFYNDLMEIMKAAQSEKERMNVFKAVSYSAKWLTEVKGSYYYGKYYKKSWSIPYLDGMMTEVISRLEAHASGNDAEKADFSDMIEK